ncbi:MAG TPA: ricin-type beta-trefoil lectin domain protein [Pseudonocardiaceae bacterium]
MTRTLPRLLPAAAALLTALATALALPGTGDASPNAGTTTVQPLPPELEQIRQAEAVALYGSPEIRPLDQRKTSIATLGDSEISGEGQGPYERGTNGDDDGDGDQNWCHRALHAAVHRTSIPVDETYNLACSGGRSANLIQGSGARQWDELNQGDYLAIKARNTHVKLVWIVVGANDPGGLEFGPLATDCAISRIFFLGECWRKYSNQIQARVDVSSAEAEKAITSVKRTMAEAGYQPSDYELVVMSYPSPVSPDVEDNPNFPGWYNGGCLFYLRDAAFGRNKVVPLFEQSIRRAALAAGARYLDASRLFHGHEPCTDNTWVSGITYDGSNPLDPNAWRQSAHPNARGHGAFASCMTQFYAHPTWNIATCVDPASTGTAQLYPGSMEFRQLRNAASGLCVDSEGYSTRNGYRLLQYTCHGGGNQGWWYDQTLRSLHIELTHDRCADVSGGVAAGRPLIVYDCHGGSNQKFVLDGGLIRSAAQPDLCVAAPNTDNGAPLTLATCDPDDARQHWIAEEQTGTRGFGYDDWIPSSAY